MAQCGALFKRAHSMPREAVMNSALSALTFSGSQEFLKSSASLGSIRPFMCWKAAPCD